MSSSAAAYEEVLSSDLNGGNSSSSGIQAPSSDDNSGLIFGKKNRRSRHASADLQSRLFRVYYWITRERNTGITQALILIVIQFAQVFDLLISPTMKLPFKGSLYEDVSNFFDIIRIYPSVIRHAGHHTYWFFMFTMLVLTVGYFIMLLLIDGSIKMSKGKTI